MRKLLTSFCFFALLSSIHAIDAGDQVKMVLAKQKLFAGQYIGALNLYKEVLQNIQKMVWFSTMLGNASMN